MNAARRDRDLVKMLVVRHLEQQAVTTDVSLEGLPLPRLQPLPGLNGRGEQCYKNTQALTREELKWNVERVRGLARLHTQHADAMQALMDAKFGPEELE